MEIGEGLEPKAFRTGGWGGVCDAAPARFFLASPSSPGFPLPSVIGLAFPSSRAAEDRGNDPRSQAARRPSRLPVLGVEALIVLRRRGPRDEGIPGRLEDGPEVTEGDRLEGVLEARPLDGDDPFLSARDERGVRVPRAEEEVVDDLVDRAALRRPERVAHARELADELDPGREARLLAELADRGVERTLVLLELPLGELHAALGAPAASAPTATRSGATLDAVGRSLVLDATVLARAAVALLARLFFRGDPGDRPRVRNGERVRLVRVSSRTRADERDLEVFGGGAHEDGAGRDLPLEARPLGEEEASRDLAREESARLAAEEDDARALGARALDDDDARLAAPLRLAHGAAPRRALRVVEAQEPPPLGLEAAAREVLRGALPEAAEEHEVGDDHGIGRRLHDLARRVAAARAHTPPLAREAGAPVLVEDAAEDLLVDRVVEPLARVDALDEGPDVGPAVPVELDPDRVRSVPEHEGEKLADADEVQASPSATLGGRRRARARDGRGARRAPLPMRLARPTVTRTSFTRDRCRRAAIREPT